MLYKKKHLKDFDAFLIFFYEKRVRNMLNQQSKKESSNNRASGKPKRKTIALKPGRIESYHNNTTKVSAAKKLGANIAMPT